MRSGAISKTVELWKKNPTRNAFGEYVGGWYHQKTMRAFRGVLRGFQTIDNQEVFDINWLSLTVRNQHHGLSEEDRIKYEGRMYQIEVIIPDYSGRWLKITCKRVNE